VLLKGSQVLGPPVIEDLKDRGVQAVDRISLAARHRHVGKDDAFVGVKGIDGLLR
jgi:hypothetical protein